MKPIAITPNHLSSTREDEPDLLHPYTVCYLDGEFNPYQYCCYAHDKEHARLSAMEMVQHIHDHPESIKWIVKENTDFDW